MKTTYLILVLSSFAIAGNLAAQSTPPAIDSAESIDFEKARALLQKQNRGGKLTGQEANYLERAKAARRARQRQSQDSRAIYGKESIGLKPLTEMTADDRYLGEDGGLYGGGKNVPPEEHRIAAEAALALVQPRNSAGEPAVDGRIGFISISMSNATQEFSMFKQLADADAAKSNLVTIVDCAQGGQAMAEWVDPQAGPWKEAERRLSAARISPQQVQVAWIKLANKGPRGDLEEHGRKLEADTLAVIQNAKAKFPNLRVAYLSSRIYGGYSSGALNPEPYAYESAFPARWLIQRQINGDEVLTYSGDKPRAPLLLWGPYLWADGVTPRHADKLAYARDDLAADGTHPSQAGRRKIAKVMLDFFKTDPLAKLWFAK